jgi:hypothetical protein
MSTDKTAALILTLCNLRNDEIAELAATVQASAAMRAQCVARCASIIAAIVADDSQPFHNGGTLLQSLLQSQLRKRRQAAAARPVHCPVCDAENAPDYERCACCATSAASAPA